LQSPRLGGKIRIAFHEHCFPYALQKDSPYKSPPQAVAEGTLLLQKCNLHSFRRAGGWLLRWRQWCAASVLPAFRRGFARQGNSFRVACLCFL